MDDTMPPSVTGNIGSTTDRVSLTRADANRPSSSHSPDDGPLMGESHPMQPTLVVSASEESLSGGDEDGPFDVGALPDFSREPRAAQTLITLDRIAVVEERKKNMVLMDFFQALGYSMAQLNDFKAQGTLPPKPPAYEVFAKSPYPPARPLSPSPAISSELPTSPAAGKPSLPQNLSSASGEKSWSAVVTGNGSRPDQRVTLQYHPPQVCEGKLTINPPISVLKKGLLQWRNSLTGHFLHSKLPFSVVEPFVQKHWGGLGLAKVLLHAKGYYVFKFNTPEDRDNILAMGPWYISNKLLRLRPWKEGVANEQDTCTKTPVWVKFHGIPYSYWTPEGLSFIASGVGKPLFLDKPTERMIPMKFARVCVEIGLHSALPKTLPVTIIDEEADSNAVVEVQVEYQSLPPRCLSCQTFGHSRLKCPKAHYQWQPKTSSPTEVGTGSAEVHGPQVCATASTSGKGHVQPCSPTQPEAPLSDSQASHASTDALDVLAGSSPTSCSPKLNNPLINKLKEVDEKERRDKRASSGGSGASLQHSSTDTGDPLNDPFQLTPLTTIAEWNVKASKRKKGKGRTSPQKTPPP